MKPASPFTRGLLFLCASFLCAPITAQLPAPVHGPAPARPAAAPITIPALLLSDIHFDPFLDPTKAVALNAAPDADWPRILAGPSGPALSPAQQAAFAACRSDKDPGTDTSYALWQSTLDELKKTATSSRFVVISGDILAHKFDCKYKALVAGATDAGYLDFTLRTVRYVIATLRSALPTEPIYTALGNNDSGCTDYALDAEHDAFLAGLAPFVAEAAALPEKDRAAVEHNFSALGAYNVPLAALPHTHILSFDDLYLSARYNTCSGVHDLAPSAAAIAWLKTQLDQARAAHERVWFVSHIPPGVDLYATARKLTNVCGGEKPTMFLGSDDLARTLAAYSDVVRLGIFAHTHADEFRLLAPEPNASGGADSAGIPLKLVGSISPIHGNRPTFTVARIDPAAATLVDYTVMMASDPAQSPITWEREYTYSATYHQPAFDPASLTALVTDFLGDPGDKLPSSQAYIRNYYPAESDAAAENSAVISAAWQPYACSLDHLSAKSFAACACRK